MDIFSENVDPTRDLPKKRTVSVEDGTDFHIKQEDPHGFWYIHREKGQIPAKLQGAWTSFAKAKAAIDLYLSQKETK